MNMRKQLFWTTQKYFEQKPKSRAIVQRVIADFSFWKPTLNPTLVYLGFVVDELILKGSLLPVRQFNISVHFHQWHTHSLIYRRRYITSAIDSIWLKQTTQTCYSLVAKTAGDRWLEAPPWCSDVTKFNGEFGPLCRKLYDYVYYLQIQCSLITIPSLNANKAKRRMRRP